MFVSDLCSPPKRSVMAVKSESSPLDVTFVLPIAKENKAPALCDVVAKGLLSSSLPVFTFNGLLHFVIVVYSVYQKLRVYSVLHNVLFKRAN